MAKQNKSKTQKATALAHPNIALIKYWGKRNEELKLPYTNSFSVTLDTLQTKTTVEFDPELEQDSIIFNGTTLGQTSESLNTDPSDASTKQKEKIIKHLNLVWRYLYNKERDCFARVSTQNNFPTAAGIASSASGFAALTYAIVKALNVEVYWREISMLARQGSGSASRSIFDGFVEWEKGTNSNGDDSFAMKMYSKNYWPEFRVIVAIVTEAKKPVGSAQAMRSSVKTSPLYPQWIKKCERDLFDIKKAFEIKAFSMVGKIAEENCIFMHQVMEQSEPPIVYRNEDTHTVTQTIIKLREQKIPCYFTIDAGPNVKVLCLEKDVEQINQTLNKLECVVKTITCKVGDGVTTSKEELF